MTAALFGGSSLLHMGRVPVLRFDAANKTCVFPAFAVDIAQISRPPHHGLCFARSAEEPPRRDSRRLTCVSPRVALQFHQKTLNVEPMGTMFALMGNWYLKP